MKIPVMIDCDPGIDDAVALMLALSSDKLDVRGITTVAGNQTIDKTTANALKIAAFVHADTPVSRGAAKPLIKSLVTAEWIHGKTGLGNAKIPDTSRTATGKTAVEALYETAARCNGDLSIIALGPLTNIALLFCAHPDAKKLICRITLMGGACYGGNSTACAEFNIFTDPEAARIVFESGVPITMCGLDVTEKTYIDRDEITKLVSKRTPVAVFAGELLGVTFGRELSFRRDRVVMHDALAVASVIDSDIIETKPCHIDIETKGEFTTGKTVARILNNGGEECNAFVGFASDRGRFVKMLFSMVEHFQKSGGGSL